MRKSGHPGRARARAWLRDDFKAQNSLEMAAEELSEHLIHVPGHEKVDGALAKELHDTSYHIHALGILSKLRVDIPIDPNSSYLSTSTTHIYISYIDTV